MLFDSPAYLGFLILLLPMYFLLKLRGQNLLLLLASYAFYAFWDYRFLGLIWLSTVVDYAAGRRIDRSRRSLDRTGMRRWLLVSLAVNLGVLGFFKYFNFFVDSARSALLFAGIETHTLSLSIILPIGISFYTFQTLSYTIDIYNERMRPVDSFLDFALFVAFFPQLVAGPIERASRLLPQIQHPRRVGMTDWAEGWNLIIMGLFRKVVVADTAAYWVDPIFSSPGEYSSLQLFAGLFLYALQIYCDFSGYSNIARGSSQLLGIELMRNFHHPYFASSISEFWQRWHISLSTWLRDYVYIPLGGNRASIFRVRLNLMATMLLGGLWHGANWTFVVWGALHGLFLVASRQLSLASSDFGLLAILSPATRRVLKTAAVFAVVSFAWLFFRAPSGSIALVYLEGLLALEFEGARILIPSLLLAGLVLALDWPQAWLDDEHFLLRTPIVVRSVAMATMLLLVLIGGGADEPFIYFQF